MNKKFIKFCIISLVFTLALLVSFSLTGCNAKVEGLKLKERTSEELHIMSYNIRTRTPTTNIVDKWSNRKEALVGHIMEYSPDIIGMQEVKPSQQRFLSNNMSGYQYVGRSRELFAGIGEGLYIYYRPDRVELIEYEVFWLSQTPSRVSKGWDGDCKRICVLARFKDKTTGNVFDVYNVHLDHNGKVAREESIKMLLERIKKGDKPAVLLGDFNFDEGGETYNKVVENLDDSKSVARETMSSITYHDYYQKNEPRTIDFCFLSREAFYPLEYSVLYDMYNDVYTSDHYALLIKLKFNKEWVPLNVMSYNIRCASPLTTNEVDKWSNRKEGLLTQLNELSPDIIAMQEVTPMQIEFFEENFTEYDVVYEYRDPIPIFTESLPIYYKKDKFDLLDQGTFWLSETPDTMSRGWDAYCPRICTFVQLRDIESGKIFTVFNTHLDHKGVEARQKGVEIILEKMENSDSPAILMGDFNFNENSENYTVLTSRLNDTKYIARQTMDAGTFNSYTHEDTTGKSPIDFCFVEKEFFIAQKYEVLMGKQSGAFVSDHYAVLVDLLIK